MNVLLLQLALFGYLGALLFFLADVAAPKDVFRKAGTRFLAGSTVAHALQAALTWVAGSPPGALSMLAFLLAGGYLLLQRRYALRGPAIVAAASAAILYFASFLLDRGTGEGGAGLLMATSGAARSSVWTSVHLVFVLSGMASFFLGFVSAVLYLVKERALKRRLPSALSQRLSPLETLDAVASSCLLAGLALLTFGIASGMLLNHAAHEIVWRWSAHELTALAPWVVLLILFIVRVSAGWRGRRAAVLNVFGFTVTVAFLAFGLVGLS